MEKQGLEILAQNQNPVKYAGAGLTAAKLFIFIYTYQEHLAVMNVAKGKMDAAFKNDVEAFREAKREFKTAAYKVWQAKTELKRRAKFSRFKIHVDLLKDAMRKIAFMENTIIGAEKYLKDANKSPAQLEAARKASIRMQLQWGA